jgi:hypothetical protein
VGKVSEMNPKTLPSEDFGILPLQNEDFGRMNKR